METRMVRRLGACRTRGARIRERPLHPASADDVPDGGQSTHTEYVCIRYRCCFCRCYSVSFAVQAGVGSPPWEGLLILLPAKYDDWALGSCDRMPKTYGVGIGLKLPKAVVFSHRQLPPRAGLTLTVVVVEWVSGYAEDAHMLEVL